MIKFFLFIITATSILFPKVYIVIDENDNPIENVQAYNNLFGTVSDKNGTFNLGNECLDYTLSHIGFQSTIINPCKSIKEKITLYKSPIPNQEIVVQGDLSKSKLKNTVSDIDILTRTNLRNSNKETLNDILQTSTNINHSGVSSRLRYFQIRGIGEYEQFTGQGGPNYYVGTLIDNFNFSGFGAPIFMFDVEQVEIFKGSQSFTFGHNSMAGQIRINTTKPKPLKESKISFEGGSFNKKAIHLMYNRPISKNINFRLSSSKNKDDGFIYNEFINDYSNKRDELVSSIKLSFNKSLKENQKINLLLNILDFNLNNNYDRWSSSNFQNFNDFISYSDFTGLPGNKSLDALDGISKSLELNYKIGSTSLMSVLTKDNLNLNHNYDGDWSNPNHWGNYYFPFSQTERRKRNTNTFETKILTSFPRNTIIFGFFNKELDEKDNANGFIFDLVESYISNFNSNYNIKYSSYYFQINHSLNSKNSIILNVREDNYDNQYYSSSNIIEYGSYASSTNQSPIYKKKETIHSGRIALKLDKIYLSLSQGHKAGGFNQNPFVSELNRFYKPEYSRSFEFGYKDAFGRLNIDLNYFYMMRNNLHVNIADQADTNNPLSFYFFTSNIENGINEGLDLNMNLNANNNTNLFFNVGFLFNTMRDAFSYSSGLDINGEVNYIYQKQREQARAPRYTINAGLEAYVTSNFFIRFETVLKDRYYYFDNQNEMSKAYQLINLNSRYQFSENLSISLNINNALDEKYSIHAFYFSLDGFMDPQLYESPGDPTSFSIKLDYKF